MTIASLAKSLAEIYHEWICASIDADGIAISHGLVLHADDTLTVIALALPPPEAYAVMLTEWVTKRPKEMIFAFDRFAKPGQGTTLGDMMAGQHLSTGATSRSFIVEYQHDPRIVLPMNYGNSFWNEALEKELFGAADSLRRRP